MGYSPYPYMALNVRPKFPVFLCSQNKLLQGKKKFLANPSGFSYKKMQSYGLQLVFNMRNEGNKFTVNHAQDISFFLCFVFLVSIFKL